MSNFDTFLMLGVVSFLIIMLYVAFEVDEMQGERLDAIETRLQEAGL